MAERVVSQDGWINKNVGGMTLQEILDSPDVTKEDLASIVLQYRDELLPQLDKEFKELERLNKVLEEQVVAFGATLHMLNMEAGGLTVSLECREALIVDLKLRIFNLEHPDMV